MFYLARRFIKTGFMFLVAGLLIGLYMIVTSHFASHLFYYELVTVHVHIILFGFLMSLIMGVAIWMFPRTKDSGSYSPGLAEAVYWFLAAGTSLRAAFEILSIFVTTVVVSFLIVLGGLMQVTAAILFVYNIWSRVRPVGRLK